MPIEKGQAWGAPGELPASSPVLGSDAEVAAVLTRHDVVGVEEGDLARTLGIRKPYDRAASKHLAPIDAIKVVLDDASVYWAVAHVTLGSPLRSRTFTAIMNAAFIGRQNIAPRAHPGDGKVDVVTIELALADRFKAWRRMPTGSHLPHPGIGVSRASSGTVICGSSATVRVDGRVVGRSSTVRYFVEPDAITIAI